MSTVDGMKGRNNAGEASEMGMADGTIEMAKRRLR